MIGIGKMFSCILLLVMTTAVPLNRNDVDELIKNSTTDNPQKDKQVLSLANFVWTNIREETQQGGVMINDDPDYHHVVKRHAKIDDEGEKTAKSNKRFDQLKLLKDQLWDQYKFLGNVSRKQTFLKKLAFLHFNMLLSKSFQIATSDSMSINRLKQQEEINKHHGTDEFQDLECLYLQAYHKKWILMKSVCPRSFSNTTMRAFCEEPSRQHTPNVVDISGLPVQTKTGLVYRNIFCARCNGARFVESWDVKLVCDGLPRVDFVSSEFNISLLGRISKGQTCSSKLIPKFEEKIKPCAITRRRSYQHYQMDNELANGGPKPTTYPKSFAILMNFGFDGKTHILFQSTHEEIDRTSTQGRCSGHAEVYNPDYDRCQTVVCPDGYILDGHSCMPDASVNAKAPTSDELENLDSLNDLETPSLIKLRANVSFSEIRNIMDPFFNNLVKRSVCTFLNISCERIQKFKTVPLNSNGEPYTFTSATTTSAKVHHSTYSTLSTNDLSTESPTTHLPDTTSRISTLESNQPNISHTTGPTVSSQSLNEFTNIIHDQTKTTLKAKKNTFAVKHLSGIKKKTKPDGAAIVEMSFVLLPPRRVKGGQEGNSTNVMQKMKEVIEKHKFSISLNGTSFDVVNMDNTDDDIDMDAFCKRGITKIYVDDEFDVVISYTENITTVYIQETNTEYMPGMYDLTVMVLAKSRGNVTNVNGYVLVCVMPRIANSTCGRLNFTDQDYKLLPNKSIILHSRLYTMNEYVVLDDKVGNIEICVPSEYYHPEKLKRSIFVFHGCNKGYEVFQKAEGYLTAILGRASILAMTTVLVTYVLLKKLRNLPGCNTMNLTFSLLVAESIFIVGEDADVDWLCSFVAVALHYFILASFFWMNVMTFDVFRTFANKCILTRIRDRGKFLWRYSLYAWGSPLIVVGICAFIDFSGVVKGFRIGYGGLVWKLNVTDQHNHSYHPADDQNGSDRFGNDSHVHNVTREVKSLGCWIQNPAATLIVFGAPMVVLFVVNAYLFVRTILCIQRTTKMAHISTRRSSLSHMTGRYDVMLYVRMSTVMGFTWIFGLASSIVSGSSAPPTSIICYTVHSLSILFTIFNCSQGIFILFAFVIKRRVWLLYKDEWKGLVRRFKKMKQFRANAYSEGLPPSRSTNSSTTTISHIT